MAEVGDVVQRVVDTVDTVEPGEGADPALVVSDVSKRYGRGAESVQALDGVSLSVARGEIVALLGNNGAGKSTLMSAIAGLLAVDDGEVRVCGDATTRGGGRPSRRLGLAPQEEAVYPTLSARRNLMHFGRLAGLRGAALAARVDDVARRLLLADLLDRTASELSGGQRRRLHTGLALMHAPDVLLLDEPTVGVDIDARAELLEFVRSAARDGAAILYSTHQLHEVAELGARVVVLDGGRVLASGPLVELVEVHAPPLAELRFDSDRVVLPQDMADAVDEAGWMPSGDYRVSVRLAHTEVLVAELVEILPEGARSSLRSASVVEPNLEVAYRRIVRGGGPPR